MSAIRPRSPEVERALDLLRAGDITVTAAARQAGAARKTVSDNWNDERARGQKASDARRKQTPHMELAPNEVPIFFRDYSHLDKLHIFPLGDVHIGSANFQAEKWQEWIDYVVAHDDVSFLGTGDFLNTALKDSVSDVYTEVSPVRQAKKDLRQQLRPIAEAGRLDLLIPGNHEGRITKATGDCPIEDIADWLNATVGSVSSQPGCKAANYAPVSALVVYRVGGIEYEVAIRHGSGSGRAGAQAGRMERESQTIIADVYVTGHTHRQQVVRGAVFQRVGKQMQRRRQVYVSSGSFLSYEEYAARTGLPPADVGCPRIRLDGERRDVHASI